MSKTINRLISDFLIYSYCYYELGKSIIEDIEFDKISSELLERFDEVESSNHIHKDILTKDMLSASSTFDMKNYPSIVTYCALAVVKEYEEQKEEKKNQTINDLF